MVYLWPYGASEASPKVAVNFKLFLQDYEKMENGRYTKFEQSIVFLLDLTIDRETAGKKRIWTPE